MTSLQGLFPGESATDIMQNVYDGITAALPQLLTTGTDIIMNLANGIMAALPNMVTTAGDLIVQFSGFLMDNAPTLLSAAADLMVNLVNGIISNLPQIASAAVSVVLELYSTMFTNMPKFIEAGAQFVVKIVSGFSQAAPQLWAAITKICQDAAASFKKYDWVALGKAVVDGIIKGIKDMGSALITAILSLCQNALGAVKKFFGIASPSKVMADEVGRYIPEGIALGIEKNADSVYDAMNDLKTDAIEAAAIMDIGTTPQFSGSQSNDGIMARMDAMLTLMERYFPEMADSNGNISISAINRSLGVAYS